MKSLLILSILAILGGNPARFLQNRQQEKTVETLTDLDGGRLYMMDYRADYRLQDVIEANLLSQGMLQSYLAGNLLNLDGEALGGLSMIPACSAFQAVTPEGDVIYGRNFDYDFKDGASIMMRTRPRKGFSSMGMVTMNFVGIDGTSISDGETDLSMLVGAPYIQMDGMNERGLAVSILALVIDDCAQQYVSGRNSISTPIMVRMLLDRASTVDEAIEMLRGYNFFADGTQKERAKNDKINYHFLLSDASGKTALIEYVKKDGPKSKSEWVLSVLDEKFVTNHFRTVGWFKGRDVDDRYLKMQSTLSKQGAAMTEEEAMRLLSDVHQEADPKSPVRTQWSVVYNLTRGTAKVCMDHDFSRVYEFSLRRFRKSGKLTTF